MSDHYLSCNDCGETQRVRLDQDTVQLDGPAGWCATWRCCGPIAQHGPYRTAGEAVEAVRRSLDHKQQNAPTA